MERLRSPDLSQGIARELRKQVAILEGGNLGVSRAEPRIDGTADRFRQRLICFPRPDSPISHNLTGAAIAFFLNRRARDRSVGAVDATLALNGLHAATHVRCLPAGETRVLADYDSAPGWRPCAHLLLMPR
jgi:hypothetical protein